MRKYVHAECSTIRKTVPSPCSYPNHLKSLDWLSIDLHALRMLSVSHSVLVLTVEIGFEAHSLPTNIDSISCEDIVYGLKSTWK